MTVSAHTRQPREGLKAARFFMVLSSLSPLFILLAIRGNYLIPDNYFIAACALMVIAPNAFLVLRLCTARRNSDRRSLAVGDSDDNRGHVLTYLFATVLPFYREELASFRDLVAMFVALSFIAFLFWHLNLYYMNVLFALFGYRVFTVSPPEDENPYTGKEFLILITRRKSLLSGERVDAYRLSDTVYVEIGP